MRNSWLALTSTLLLGLAIAAEEPRPANHWWNGWFGGKSAGKDSKEAKADDKGLRPPSATVLAAQKAQIKADYQRRLEVCQKLQEIAAAKADDDLQRMAEVLEQRNFDLYRKQLGQLPIVTTADDDEGGLPRKKNQGSQGD